MGDGGEAVRLERTFRADNERVFRAFTEPAEVVLWWGPMNVRTSVAEIDGCGTSFLDSLPLTAKGPQMPTDETGRVARAYHDAWTNRKGPEAHR
jgi:hypothetical protein